MNNIQRYIEKSITSRNKKTFGKIVALGANQADILLPDGSILHGVRIIGGSEHLDVGQDVSFNWSMDPRVGYERPVIHGSGGDIIYSQNIANASYLPVENGIPMANEFAKIHRDWLPIDYVESVVIFSPIEPSVTVPGMFWIDTSS